MPNIFAQAMMDTISYVPKTLLVMFISLFVSGVLMELGVFKLKNKNMSEVKLIAGRLLRKREAGELTTKVPSPSPINSLIKKEPKEIAGIALKVIGALILIFIILYLFLKYLLPGIARYLGFLVKEFKKGMKEQRRKNEK